MIGDINYKIILRENPIYTSYDIFMFKDTPHGRYLITQNGKTLTETLLEKEAYHGDVAPSLSLDRDMLAMLQQEITRLGIELPSVSKVEGLYEAQTEHLKDLRQLLKLK